MDQTGAVIVFKPEVTPEQAKKALEKIKDLIQSGSVNEFDPEWGSPVWYVP